LAWFLRAALRLNRNTYAVLSHDSTAMKHLLHELILNRAEHAPDASALAELRQRRTYAELASEVVAAANGMVQLGLIAGERVGIYLDKRIETVVACFGACAAGGAFVPINPVLKPEQVAYILQDCGVRILVTSIERLHALEPSLSACSDLHTIVVLSEPQNSDAALGRPVVSWRQLLEADTGRLRGHRRIDTDITGILYTSGSTGKPKGVVLSHRNMVAGAESVAHYLENGPSDRILSALPLSFDAGISQLTTAFWSGASVFLINYLLPRDVIIACERERITGLTAVPPLWIQLGQLEWPQAARESLRYFANTGGKMPRATLDALRAALPKTKPYLMYGLT